MKSKAGVIVKGYRKSPGGVITVERNGVSRRYSVSNRRYRWITAVLGQTADSGVSFKSSFLWRISKLEIANALRWMRGRGRVAI
jgi:hypothetical protein